MSELYRARLARIRTVYPRAYTPWTQDDQALLKQQYLAGKSVEQIAQFLQRQPSAIRSRLKRLELIPGENSRPNRETTPVILDTPSAIALTLKARWQPVFSGPGDHYQFPAPITIFMSRTYNHPAIYCWQVVDPDQARPGALYIGPTKQLCLERLAGYLEPGNSATSQRIRRHLVSFQEQGYRVILAILSPGEFKIGGIQLQIIDYHKERDRLFIEDLLITYYRLAGYRLLNL
ncbi:MAG: hypothetical protein AB1894_04975 [Chloroflexota bacterium]